MKTQKLKQIFVLIAMLIISACSQRAALMNDDSAQAVNPAPAASVKTETSVSAETPAISAEQPQPQLLPGFKSAQPEDVAAEESATDEEQTLPFEEELEERDNDLSSPESMADDTAQPVGNIFKLPL